MHFDFPPTMLFAAWLFCSEHPNHPFRVGPVGLHTGSPLATHRQSGSLTPFYSCPRGRVSSLAGFGHLDGTCQKETQTMFSYFSLNVLGGLWLTTLHRFQVHSCTTHHLFPALRVPHPSQVFVCHQLSPLYPPPLSHLAITTNHNKSRYLLNELV